MVFKNSKKCAVHFGFLLMALMLICAPYSTRGTECFASQRLPKIVQVQQNLDTQVNSGEAIAAHDALNAIFVGGHINQSNWSLYGQTTSAHVGRVNLDTRMWAWQQQFTETTVAVLNVVTALAVDPAGEKLACHGFSATIADTNTFGYLFVLDTNNGAIISGLMQMEHVSAYTVKSAGFLFRDTGYVYMAFNHLGSGNTVHADNFDANDQYPHIAIYNSITNEMVSWKRVSNDAGVSASLVETSSNDIFMGANMRNNSKWFLAIYKIQDSFTTGTVSEKRTQLIYTSRGLCNSAEWGFEKNDMAPYISHLGYDDTTANGQLFGVTITNNHAGNKAGFYNFVFRIELDSNKDATGSFNIMEIDSNFGDESYWIGMRPTMELIDLEYYIHAIYYQAKDKLMWYLRISPDSATSQFALKINRKEKNSVVLGYEAVWIGSVKQDIQMGSGEGYGAYESYWVGGEKSEGKVSYQVLPVFEDDFSCYVAEANKKIEIKKKASDCTQSQLSTIDWIDSAITDYENTKNLSQQILDVSLQYPQTDCNIGPVTIQSTASVAQLFEEQCYNYGTSGTISFIPPIIDNPADCTDIKWLYTVKDPLQALPTSLQINFDTDTNEMSWGYIPGFDPTLYTYGTFNLVVTGMLPVPDPNDTQTMMKQEAFTVTIILDCCSFPTVFTAPTVPFTAYEYIIGETQMSISLSDIYRSDQTCCVLTPQIPVTSPTPVDSFLFQLQVDTITTAVYKTDMTGFTPNGLGSSPYGLPYTITYSNQVLSSCQAAVIDVSYTVEIISPCETAIFIIDSSSSIFLPLGSNTAYQYVLQPVSAIGILEWKSITDITPDITSSIISTDPCGAVIEELTDVTTGVEVALDSEIFVLDTTTNAPTNTLTLQTVDATKRGVYSLQLKVYYDNFQSFTEVMRVFEVEFIDPCLDEIMTIDDTVFITSVLSSDISLLQFVNYDYLRLEWSDIIISKSLNPTYGNLCGSLTHEIWDVRTGSRVALDAAVFTLNDLSLSTKTLDVYTDDFGKVDLYSLRFVVYYTEYNQYQFEKDFLIEVQDYCFPTSVTKTLFSDNPLTYIMGETSVSSTFASLWTTEPAACNLYFQMISLPTPADPNLIIFEAPMTVKVEGNVIYYGGDQLTGTYTPGTYQVELRAWADNSVDTTESQLLTVIIEDPCLNPIYNFIVTPVSPLSTQNYAVGSNMTTYDVQEISQNGFYASNPICEDVQFSFEIFWYVDSQVPFGFIQEDADCCVVSFKTNGSFEVHTNDINLIGFHEIHISASLIEHSSVTTGLATTILPFEFGRCETDIYEWFMNYVIVPALSPAQQFYEEPGWQYKDGECSYYWETYEVQVIYFEDQSLLTKTEQDQYFSFDEAGKLFNFFPQSVQTELVLTVSITATLSDKVSFAQSIFNVTFEMDPGSPVPNHAPYFLIVVEDEYVRSKQNFNSTELQSVVLGKFNDFEQDNIDLKWECVTCQASDTFFTFNSTSNTFVILPGTPARVYRFEITLSDDNEQPKSRKYSFKIVISKPPQPVIVQEEEEVVFVPIYEEAAAIQFVLDRDSPSFSLQDLNDVGLLTVQFTQSLKVVEDLSQINQKTFEITLLPDETNIIEDPSTIGFIWEVIEFNAYSMKIQIDFNLAVQISSGLQRDRLSATVKKPELFFSSKSKLEIPLDTSQSIKAPKMMPNTSVTQVFTSLSSGLETFTSSALIGNFLINLLLSGSMAYLWGLLHCMQIVAHFPLVNVMMPGNAHSLFQILVQIATFSLLPTEEFVEEMENEVGLSNDGKYLSDSFQDFGFDSTGPIRNLQIIFLFMLLLMGFPLFSLLLRGLCFWSDRMKRCMDRMNKAMYYNTYIRFGLEGYLEFSISSVLRFSDFQYRGEDSSDNFHSILALAILSFLVFYIIFSLIFLQCKLKDLDKPESISKFGAYYEGLKTKQRTALLQPILFMLRRLLYACILVYWMQSSHFQIIFMLSKCLTMIIYVGQFAPWENRFTNYLDLCNETFTLICSYSLVMFSLFVPSAETRYLCGWYLIGFVAIILVFNLGIIIIQGLCSSINKCKLKYKRLQVNRFVKQRNKRQRAINMANQRIENDSFYKLQVGFSMLNNPSNKLPLGNDHQELISPGLKTQYQADSMPATFYKQTAGSPPGNENQLLSISQNSDFSLMRQRNQNTTIHRQQEEEKVQSQADSSSSPSILSQSMISSSMSAIDEPNHMRVDLYTGSQLANLQAFMDGTENEVQARFKQRNSPSNFYTSGPFTMNDYQPRMPQKFNSMPFQVEKQIPKRKYTMDLMNLPM